MVTHQDFAALKAYVSNPLTSLNQAESTVRITVTHSNLAKSKFVELRVDKHISIDNLKVKLSTHVGTSSANMILQLQDDNGKYMATLTDITKPLGYYSPYDGCIIHVLDLDPHSASANGWLEDLSKVEKYVMSDDKYNKRDNTYRKYKEEKLKTDPTWTLEKEICMRTGKPYVAPATKESFDDDYLQAEAAAISVGDRCEVDPGGKRGVVRYVGRCEGLPGGFWVGVQYDEPVGKNDGSVKGKRYFDVPSGYGGLVRPTNVRVGDYPPLDEEWDLSGDEI